MSRYIVRRLLVALPTVLAVAVVASAIIPERPEGSPIRVVDPCSGRTSSLSEEQRVRLVYFITHMSQRSCHREFVRLLEMKAEQSFPQRSVAWAGRALRGDLGMSLQAYEPVSELIARRLPASAQLALMAMAVAALMAVSLGVLAAVWRDRWPDHLARLMSAAGQALPEFLLATVVFFALSYWVGWLPDLAYPTVWESPAASLLAFLFPALIVGWRIGALSTSMTRSAVLDVLRQDHVRTGRAKGLSEHAVLKRHVLPNALPGVLTIMVGQLPALLAGLVVVEIVFGIPGIGTLGFDAVRLQDYPVVQGVVLVTALCVIGANLVVDVASAAMDPRIRKHEGDARPRYAL